MAAKGLAGEGNINARFLNMIVLVIPIRAVGQT